jgi:hypothetical protein
VGEQLLAPPLLPLVDEIGQDHDVGMVRQGVDRLERAFDRLLAIHLGIEESTQQRPDLFLRHDFARSTPRQRIAEIAVHPEIHGVLLPQPVAEMGDHVQQHFVAIGNDQGAVHEFRTFAAWISWAGSVSSASAQAIRSGS